MNNEDQIIPKEVIKDFMLQAMHNMGFESIESYKAACEKMPPAVEFDLSLCEDWSDDDFPGSKSLADKARSPA
jgi:hypothetical protein